MHFGDKTAGVYRKKNRPLPEGVLSIVARRASRTSAGGGCRPPDMSFSEPQRVTDGQQPLGILVRYIDIQLGRKLLNEQFYLLRVRAQVLHEPGLLGKFVPCDVEALSDDGVHPIINDPSGPGGARGG